MSLKKRIAIAFCCIIFIPVLITGISFYAMTTYRIHQFGKELGIDNPTYDDVYNNMSLISQAMTDELAKIRARAEKDPAVLSDQAYLGGVNSTLRDNAAYLVMVRGEELLYNGTSVDKSDILREKLTGLRLTEEEEANGFYMTIGSRCLVRHLGVVMEDGSAAELYLIGELDRIAPALRMWVVELVFYVILILVLTSLCMTIWIYQGVSAPIAELKGAAQEIRDGNLDFSVRACGVQEMRELCGDFEEMRIRLKESAERKVQFDSESKELISNISHDLKTPVTTIKGYVEGIMDGVADTPEKRTKYLKTIYNKAIDMDRLINELTLYAKIDSNKIPYTFAKIHIADYFEDCVSDLRIELEGRGIALAYFNYLRGDERIIADAEQLKRVINNIIGNSIKYMDKPKGIINIRLRDVGDFVQVEIEDNGKGIAQADLARIFDRFYRTDASRNSRRGGSGIGLSIVKKILEDHEGRVWATSKEGVGTVIYFVLRKYRED